LTARRATLYNCIFTALENLEYLDISWSTPTANIFRYIKHINHLVYNGCEFDTIDLEDGKVVTLDLSRSKFQRLVGIKNTKYLNISNTTCKECNCDCKQVDISGNNLGKEIRIKTVTLIAIGATFADDFNRDQIVAENIIL
jgi:hypothetical protein